MHSSHIKNNIYKNIEANRVFYTLYFEHELEFDDDELYFACDLPYTYSDLGQLLDNLTENKQNKDIMEKRLLCRTIAHNRVELLIITNNISNKEL